VGADKDMQILLHHGDSDSVPKPKRLKSKVVCTIRNGFMGIQDLTNNDIQCLGKTAWLNDEVSNRAVAGSLSPSLSLSVFLARSLSHSLSLSVL